MESAAVSKNDLPEVEASAEVLINDIGEMQIILRPPLSFVAEGFRVRDGRLEVYGEGLRYVMQLSPEQREEIAEIEQALLLEFPASGTETERETDILKI